MMIQRFDCLKMNESIEGLHTTVIYFTACQEPVYEFVLRSCALLDIPHTMDGNKQRYSVRVYGAKPPSTRAILHLHDHIFVAAVTTAGALYRLRCSAMVNNSARTFIKVLLFWC